MEGLLPRLRERVYVTFTALAVLLAFGSHLSGTTALTVASALTIAAVGAVLAGFVSDTIAHLAVHGNLPDLKGMRHLIAVSVGALASIVLPLILLALAHFEVISVELAVRLGVWSLALALGVIAYIAVARSLLPFWKKAAVFVVEIAFAGLVIAVELLAHG